jgi:predicted outer membrane repeat protein
MTLIDSIVSGNAGGPGGGIFASGTVTLANSTVSGNTAIFGGGIYNRRVLTLTNATVSSNTAADVGGGIYTSNSAGPVTLANSTVSGNAADSGSGIYAYILAGDTTLTNSLIDGDCAVGAEDVAFTSGGYNVESPGNTCGFDQPTDQVNVSAGDLKLGTLGDYGGPTLTHALFPNSVAIDQIPADECLDAEGAPLNTDQRGESRDSMCDVGAFEVQP